MWRNEKEMFKIQNTVSTVMKEKRNEREML